MRLQHRYVFAYASLVCGLTVTLTSAVSAQSRTEQTPDAVQLSAAADPAAGQVQAPRPIPAPVPVERPYWSSTAGFEADTHDTAYSFFGPSYHKPFRPNMQFVAGASVNYLHYAYDNGAGGVTEVRSPGLSTKAGVRIGNKNWVQLTAGPGFKRRHVQVRGAGDSLLSSSRNIEVGVSLGADVWANPSRLDNVHGMLHYGAEDGYTWSRLGYKHQITNHDWRGRFSHYLGAEFIGQGNEDITSYQVGPFVEFLHAPSSVSLMVRGGYKRSTFNTGPDKTGPWLALSFYKKL